MLLAHIDRPLFCLHFICTSHFCDACGDGLKVQTFAFFGETKNPAALDFTAFSGAFGVFVIHGRNGARTRQQTQYLRGLSGILCEVM